MTKNKLPIAPKQKALTLNMDASIYGSFAEIGAGQEVARYFFQAGGASKTVAKTMSAYDMVFSDEIYGQQKHKRYVCEERVVKMLDHEYGILQERLNKCRGEKSRFFAFANTVATSSYGSDKPGHGWIGVKFQSQSGGKANELILHVVMKDKHALSQQQALGILGVNLLYAVYNYLDNPQEILNSLYDNIEKSRIVINLVRVKGPISENPKYDNRLLNLHLVRSKMASAVMFDENGNVVLVSDHLYKKDIMVVRGSYRPPTLVNEDLINKGYEAFTKDLNTKYEKSKYGVATICELSIRNASDELLLDDSFLSRVSAINALGHKVLLSEFNEYYKLTDFFAKFSQARLAIVLGAYNFFQIFKKEDGKMLSSLGQIFQENVGVYVYPYREEGKVVDLNNPEIKSDYVPLLDFLKKSGQITNLDNYNSDIIHIYSRQVFQMIQRGQKGWEELLPARVTKVIKEKELFGYKNNS